MPIKKPPTKGYQPPSFAESCIKEMGLGAPLGKVIPYEVPDNTPKTSPELILVDDAELDEVGFCRPSRRPLFRVPPLGWP